jgi:signal transduction histidine kinase
MDEPPRRVKLGYALAPLLAAAGLGFTQLTARPFGGEYLYFPLTAVLVSALQAGFGPGLLTLVVSALGFDYFFVAPRNALAIGTLHDVHRVAEFAVAGLAGAWIGARYRSARLAAQDAAAEATRIGAQQERLVAVVGHDLRNPLSSIRTGLDLLPRLGPLEERQRGAVARMQRSARRMERLIEDLLGFARTRSGRSFPLERSTAHVGEVCARVVSEFEDAEPDRAFRLSIQGDDQALVDVARLEQVAANLVSNAVKHGAPAEPIEIAVVGTERALSLRIANRGPPIPPDLLPHVFEPFRTGDARVGGVGLGLFVVKEIVDAHGGTVGVHSADGGTVFEISLPRDPAAAPTARERRSAS